MNIPPKQSFPPPPPMASSARRASDSRVSIAAASKQPQGHIISNQQQAGGGEQRHKSAPDVVTSSHPRHHPPPPPPPLVPESSKDITKQPPVASLTTDFHPAVIPTYSSSSSSRQQQQPPSAPFSKVAVAARSGSIGNASDIIAAAPTKAAQIIGNRSNLSTTTATTAASSSASVPTTTSTTTLTHLYPSQYYHHPATTTTTTSSYSSQYPSPNLSSNNNPTTLKARNASTTNTNINASTTFNHLQQGSINNNNNSSSSINNSYILNTNHRSKNNTHRSAAAAASSSSTNHNNNNNVPIAILLLPPLFILLIYEMSSPLPLLMLCFFGLIVYALDLANIGNSGGGGGGTNSHRGFYTLCAIWIGWIVLSIVVGYVTIFWGDTIQTPSLSSSSSVMNDLEDEGGTITTTGGNNNNNNNNIIHNSSSSTNFISLGILLSKLGASIMLLFNLAAWTTLQFQWLPLQIPTLARFLERLIHFTLPPLSAAMVAYELTSSSSSLLSSSYVATLSSSWWGVDTAAIVFPLLFACHLTLGIFLVGAAPSMLEDTMEDKKGEKRPKKSGYNKNDDDDNDDENKHFKKNKAATSVFTCAAIRPREGRALSHLLVFVPGMMHLVMFRQRITYSYASWDDLFDFIFTATLPYILHYLLASNGVLDERWRSSLNWLLKSGTSPIERGRTLRGASVPMAISFLSCISLQQRYLVPVCARISYILNGHDGIMSASLATLLLSLGTIFGYATIWFFGRQNSNGEFLMGEYHEDIFQLLLGLSAVFFGLSCSPPWAALPIPMLLAESLALWVITKQLRYAFLTVFVFFTCCTILIAYRLTFLTETVEIIPGKQILLKTFATVSMFATMWLIVIIGLVHRAPGGVGKNFMKKWDVTGVCFAVYGLVLTGMEFSLLRQPMPVYSRDNFEIGRVAVYSASAVYCTGLLTLIITWHLKAQKLIKGGSAVVTSSIATGKMIAVLIEPNLIHVDNSLSALYLRWTVASLLLMTICCPYALRPVYIKSSTQLPQNASAIVVAYCAVILPLIIIASVRLVLEPLVGLLTGHNSTAYFATSPKFSEIIGYSAALWGVSVLSMVNHYLPNGGGEVWKRVAALTFIMGLFVSFSSPAFPGSAPSLNESSNLFLAVSSTSVVESDVATGGWGLVSAFLAVLLALTGPLELREMKDSAGRKDSHQFLRLMIFGLMFGCGLAWFIVMQSMSKDVFIPIFVTAFSCMVMSTLGTVCAVMGFFLETQEFGEVQQIANVWTVVAFPVFFVISSVSLSAHAHPFGIGGWASTYLSVCGLFAGSFCILVRMRKDKNSTTRGYGNVGCIISWLCAIIVVYGRYGIAGVGVVGVTTVVGIPVSILGTIFCSPILLLLEGEVTRSSKHGHQVSSYKSKWHGLVLTKLTRRNWIAPLLAGTVGVFITATLYAILLRGCGLSKFSFLFGTGDVIKNQEDAFFYIFGSKRTTGIGALDDVATMAQKSVVHTKTMIAAARLSGSGLWTAKSMFGPLMHLFGLAATLPSLQHLVNHSWYGKAPLFGKVAMVLPLNLLAISIGRGIPSLVAAATIGLIGGAWQLATIKNS